MFVLSAPVRTAPSRGVTETNARLPFYGSHRAAGCIGRWLLVGPLAWVCSDDATLTSEEPTKGFLPVGSDGLSYQYFFAGAEGASVYTRFETVGDEAPERELEPGWGVTIVERRSAHGGQWGRTRRGEWVAMTELFPARPSSFRGEKVDGKLDFGWVLAEKANVYAAPQVAGKPKKTRTRFEKIGWYEERATPRGLMIRTSADGVEPAEWMVARDLVHPTEAPPPAEVTAAEERWIDVSLATQTLVAYEGSRPVYATLVSTGRGPKGSPSETPTGVHRIWVKLLTAPMDDTERDDVDKHYSMDEVPYVMFFDKGVGLHGTYWHRDFGRVKSHGCVNLAPLDAQWLFGFTAPHLPDGWHAVHPTPLEKGTAVRVR
jgi:lipoprotein-anchoring transpeptidase ErfK/SrfK